MQKYRELNKQNYNFACLYGCETWSLTVRGNIGIGCIVNRVLKILEPKTNEVTSDCGKLHNDKLHDIIIKLLLNIIPVIRSRMRWMGHVARMGERGEMHIAICREAQRKEATRKT
jgi:hypothetical protein